MNKIITNPTIPLPFAAKDAYELADEWDTTPQTAHLILMQEGWLFIGYNDNGQPAYLPPIDDIAPTQ